MTGQRVERTADFTRAVLRDLKALRRMIEEDRIERGIRRVGAEQEVVLVDRELRPAPVASDVLRDLDDPRYTHELARFNVEINMPPVRVGPSLLADLEAGLGALLHELRESATRHETDVVLTGILPCLQESDLRIENMTPLDRYHRLNEATMRLVGGTIRLRILGIDELRVEHDSVMLEACNTSFQVHVQASADEFARLYNAAQVALAPVLAVSCNSPFLFGKRLWSETRIAVFGQSIDTRGASPARRDLTPRVRFGERWVEDSVLELFEDDVVRFRPIIADEPQEDPLEVLDAGDTPRLQALQQFNSTIYRWNRPCYGVTDGRPHLRIECRALPSGPSLSDQVANAAFWLGLSRGLVERFGDVSALLPFDAAKANFLAAARRGLHTGMAWLDGEDHSAPTLVTDELLPIAEDGLAALGIDEGDAGRYLDMIRERTVSGQTGARWMERSVAALSGRAASRPEQCATLSAALITRQWSGSPVHAWDLADPSEGRVGRGPLVDQYMTTDLFTVQQDERVDLAAFIMDREHTRQILVEDDHFHLVGLLSYRSLLRLLAGGTLDDPSSVAIRDIMSPAPITVPTGTPVMEAIRVMRENRISCLPVVEGEKLIGVLSEREFMPIAAQLLNRLFADR